MSEQSVVPAVAPTSEQPETVGQEVAPTASSGGQPAPRREIGAPRRRVEDPLLLRGQGRFVDDLPLAGALAVALVRSPYPAARVLAIEAAEATRLPGVLAVGTAEDGDLRNAPDLPVNEVVAGLRPAPHGPLARGWVRAVGEPVAAVVAESRALAADAAGLVQVGY